MLRSLTLSSLSSLLVVGALCATGCPGPATEGEGDSGGEGEATEGEGDVAEGEGDVVGEGEGEPPPPPPPNDTCATAEVISSGVAKTGTTVGAGDETGCSAGTIFDENFDVIGDGGADVAYTFTLAEEQGVHLSVVGQIDAVVSVFADPGCGGPSPTRDDRTCVDGEVADPETIDIGSLAAGTYFIVVESYDDPGTFTLNLEIVAPFCVGDAVDLAEQGNTAEAAVSVNPVNTSFSGLAQNANTANPDAPLDTHLCSGDVDYYLFGHLGGPLTLDVTAGVAEVHVADVDVQGSIDDTTLIYTEGAVVAGLPGADVDVPAGYYLIKVEDGGVVEPAFVAYSVAVEHACEGDDFDVANAEIDAFFESQAPFVALPLDAPVERSVCAADVDVIPVEILFEGTFAVTLGGDAGRNVAVEFFTVDDAGAETDLTVTRVDDDVANTSTYSADVLPGKIIARVSAGALSTTSKYTWSVTLPGLDGAPDNDNCAGAQPLTSGVTVAGRTVGAADDYLGVGPADSLDNCNFATADDGARDVFYTFNVPTASAARLTFEPLLGYAGTAALFKLPADGCPADLTTLTPVNDAFDFPVCLSFNTVERFESLDAGDYLVIIDDDLNFDTFEYDAGVFNLSIEVFADGIPPLDVCAAATALEVPDVGGTTNVVVAPADLGAVSTNFDGTFCGGGGLGEKAFVFTPAVAMDLTVTSASEALDPGFDSVLGIYEGRCNDFVDALVCDDDINGIDDRNSTITATLEAGVEYTLVVDAYEVFDDVGDPLPLVASTTLTLTAAAPTPPTP